MFNNNIIGGGRYLIVTVIMLDWSDLILPRYQVSQSVSQAVQASQELTPTLTLTGADKPAAPSVASLGDGFYSSRYHY